VELSSKQSGLRRGYKRKGQRDLGLCKAAILGEEKTREQPNISNQS